LHFALRGIDLTHCGTCYGQSMDTFFRIVLNEVVCHDVSRLLQKYRRSMVDMFQLQRPKKVEKCPPGRKNDVFGALPGGKGGIPKAPVAVGQFPQGAANGGKVWPRTLGSSTQCVLGSSCK
jgi:hypothetical protein